ncbi:UvrABC system protein [Dirofilaria immitis]
MCFTSIFFLFNLCLLTYAFPPNLLASYITQNSNQDDARNVRDIATNGSEGSRIHETLKELNLFWDNIFQLFLQFAQYIQPLLNLIFSYIFDDLDKSNIVIDKMTESSEESNLLINELIAALINSTNKKF